MSSLGSFFSPEVREQSVKRQLIPGTIIKLRLLMDDDEYHEKRFVVLEATDSTLTCVINSEVSNFIQARSEMLRCQVPIKASDYDCMDHDSYVDCSRIRTYQTEEVVRQLMANSNWILGRVAQDLAEEMMSGLKYSRLIASDDISRIEAAFIAACDGA